MNSGAPHLGIDLGTLRIAATVVRDGAVQVVDLGANGPASAAVALVGDRVVTAAEAERVLADHPDHGVRELQRRFGDTTPVVLDGRPFTADALTAEQLRVVAGAAGVDPGACHLTLAHPAGWHDYKCELLARTANLCGFADVALVPAPVAVATAYVAAGHLRAGDTVAVFDLGGTLEASVVRIGEDGASVIGTPQLLERFGGDVIDQMVFRHVASALGGALESMDRNDPAVRAAVMLLRAECAQAKERLSTDSEAAVKVEAPGLDTVVRITRDEFEASLRPPMAEALNALERAMASAGVDAGDLTGVLLVGGGARIPVVGEMVAGHLGRRAIADLDPSMAVALGATAGAVLLAATAAAAEAAASAAPDSAAGNAADAPSATTDKETTMSDKPNSDAAPADAAPGAPGSIPAPPPPPAKKGVGGKAAGVAAGVAAAAAAVAGAVVYGDDVVEALTGDDGNDTAAAAAAEAMTADQAERVAEGDDASMDAFDEVAPQGAAPGVPLDAPSGGGQPSAPQAESSSGFGRSAAPTAAPEVASEPPAPAAPPVAESMPPAPSVDPAFEDARASLIAALDEFEPPAGATPEEVEELKQNLREAIERFDPEPGQSTEEALAELRDQYDSIVTDFVQDEKIDALVQAELDREEGDEPAADEPTDEAIPVDPESADAETPADGDGEGTGLPGLDLADLEIKPIPMPVVDPDDIVVAPESPEQEGGADAPGSGGPVINPGLIDVIDGPAVVDSPIKINPDLLDDGPLLGVDGLIDGGIKTPELNPEGDGGGSGGGFFGGLQDAFDELQDGIAGIEAIGPKQDDPGTPPAPEGSEGLLGGLGDALDGILANPTGTGGGGEVAGGPGQGGGGGQGGGQGLLDDVLGGVGDLLADQSSVQGGGGPVGGPGQGGGGGQGGGQGLFGDTIGDALGDSLADVADSLGSTLGDDLAGTLPGLDDLGDALPDLGNVASDLADEISPNLPTNLEFGLDGI